LFVEHRPMRILLATAAAPPTLRRKRRGGLTLSDNNWLDGLRGVAIAAEIAAVTATSPISSLEPNDIQLADPVLDAGLTSLVLATDALEAGAEAQRLAEEISADIDVVQEASTSEPPEAAEDSGSAEGGAL
jgi:hypothetical protein